MATTTGRAFGLGAILVLFLAGGAGAAGTKGSDTKTHDQGQGTGPTDSLGAGGLSGSAATKDGARTGTADQPRPPESSKPAAGTAP